MQSWGLTSGDAGYIDSANPATLDPADSATCGPTLLLCRPTTNGFALRPKTPAEPDDVDTLRRRAGQ